jgi:hypothetical protein
VTNFELFCEVHRPQTRGVGMKGMKFSLVLIIGVAVLFTGCGPREGEEAPGEPLEIIESEEDQEPQKEVVESDGSEDEDEDKDETEAIKAVYVGRIDGNFVEILQGGEFVTYAFDQEAEDAVNPGGMASYSGVDLVVSVDQDKQKRIQSLTLADPPAWGMRRKCKGRAGSTPCSASMSV